MNELDLKAHRRRSGATLEQFARKLRTSESALSKYENGAWPHDVDLVVRIAEQYGLDRLEVVRRFLMRCGKTSAAKNTIVSLLSRGGLDGEARSDAARSLELDFLLGINPSVKAEVETIRDAICRIVTASHAYRQRNPRIIPDVLNLDHYSSFAGSKLVQRAHVFSTSMPVPIMIELHYFPARCGGLHRQPHVGEMTPGAEFWSICSGRAVLLLDAEQWQCHELDVGSSGHYRGGDTHIWLNPSKTRPLVVFTGIYPYLNSQRLGRSWSLPDPSEAMEFCIDELPEHLPAGIPRELIHRVAESM